MKVSGFRERRLRHRQAVALSAELTGGSAPA